MQGRKKSDALPVLNPDHAAAVLCLRRLSYFVREFWDVIATNDLVWNWHMDVLCDEVQAMDERVFKRLPKLSDLIINVPPGTSKTKIISVLSTAWEFARMPAIKVFVGSYSESAVSGIADEIKMVMKSDRYQRYFPDTLIRKDRDSLHNFRTTAKGEFYAFTVGGTLTSKHADILKVDDPLNPKQAASQVELDAVNSFFDKTLPTRKIDKAVTPTYLIMQRLAEHDPTGHLLEKKGEAIRHIRLPAEVTDGPLPAELAVNYVGGLLDPVRLGTEVIAEAKVDLGSAGYAGQYGQRPAPDGGLIWQRWFLEVPDDAFPPRHTLQQYSTDWDLAYTKDDENAASAYITSGKIGNKIYIDDLGWDWLEFPELIKYMRQRAAPHYIEAKASGKSAKQTLTKNGIPAIEVGVLGGSDKIARARMATPIAEAKMVYIRKSLVDKLYNDSRQGILVFPKGKYKDLADALAQCLQRQGKMQNFVVPDLSSDPDDADFEEWEDW